MVDNTVEFVVATADGEVRTINECNNLDLFWATRGGGGGSIAVLTKYRVQVYPSLPIHVFTSNAKLTGTDPDSALRGILIAHVTHRLEWSAQLLTGQLEYFSDKVKLSLVLPYADDGTKLKRATNSIRQLLSNRTDIAITMNRYDSYSSYASYLSITAADAKVTEPSGISTSLASRLIPRKIFAEPETIDELVEGVLHGIVTARRLLNLTGPQIVLETPVSNPDWAHATSANPAWRDSLWHVIHAGEWVGSLDESEVQTAADGFLKMLDPLRALTPGDGAYLNEAHYLEPNWKQTFFGSLYDRLAAVRNTYNPSHLFDFYKCSVLFVLQVMNKSANRKHSHRFATSAGAWPFEGFDEWPMEETPGGLHWYVVNGKSVDR
ncbi:hypothetical protein TI39_contig5879g00002 [Zymoseptoria brevis]|uniref:Berberine/berberine-like domain-containing protein n=1 Tax=Zymoseptoria brevis TaxID=1047168 RepID=A0A0F4G5D8_9PEZI|nr:hypothetical protein TI39_contig5879g00002 [Zymoseptoria brevis]